MVTPMDGKCEEMVKGLGMGARSLRKLDWYKAERWDRIREWLERVGKCALTRRGSEHGVSSWYQVAHAILERATSGRREKCYM